VTVTRNGRVARLEDFTDEELALISTLNYPPSTTTLMTS
jgi:hypothetical protein